MKFSEGDQVLAKLPNSKDFEKARVVDIKGGKYKIQFKGGVEHTIPESDVKAQRVSRSRSRGRPPAAKPKSPAVTRKKSPARKSPARKKSPARTTTASQARKLSVRAARQAKVTLSRLDDPTDTSSDTDVTERSKSVLDDDYAPLQTRLKDNVRATRRSIRIAASASKAETEKKLYQLRGADRAASLPAERKNQYKVSPDGKSRGMSAQRDEDLLKVIAYDSETDVDVESDGSKSKKAKVDLSKPQEWGGWLGALFLSFALPLGSILLQMACGNEQCSQKLLRVPRLRDLKQWRNFISLEASLAYAGFIAFVSIISILPIGSTVDGQQSRSGKLQYRVNGIFTLILSSAIFGGCVYQGYDVVDFLLQKSLPLTVIGAIFGVFLAIILYIKGGKVPVSHLNMYGTTNSVIYNLWQGREVNPRFGNLDIKVIIFRTAIIGTTLIDLAAIVKIVKEAPVYDLDHLNLATLGVAGLQIFYSIDSLVYESVWMTSFEFMYEGTGYMLTVGYLVYPYLATLTTRFALFNKVNIPIYSFCIFTALFFAAFFVYRKCNNQKNEFRKNPFSSSLSHLETIPTKRGKRLIVSGFWGYVRHPNYLCDILMHIALAGFSYSLDILPAFLALQVVFLLCHRATRDNARCAKRYGYAWEQYCSRVKYMICKPIF
ncbi:hypothetical protein TKK_0011951 [Trichogramma kaykai]|uniref:Lamin-B receptor n=1 Tax=Trichogramma kaykai TaxID=54128 RepID=A0ABD2WPB8_9HYME